MINIRLEKLAMVKIQFSKQNKEIMQILFLFFGKKFNKKSTQLLTIIKIDSIRFE